jgi:hypothetical protein
VTAWTDEELAAIAGANELTVAPLRTVDHITSAKAQATTLRIVRS